MNKKYFLSILIVIVIFILSGCSLEKGNNAEEALETLNKDKSQENLNPNLKSLLEKVDFNVYGFKSKSDYFWATGNISGPYYDESSESIKGVVSVKSDQQLNSDSSSIIVIEQRGRDKFDKPDEQKNTIEQISIGNTKAIGFHFVLSSGGIRGWYVLSMDDKTDILFAGTLFNGLDWSKIINDIVPNLVKM